MVEQAQCCVPSLGWSLYLAIMSTFIICQNIVIRTTIANKQYNHMHYAIVKAT